MSQEKIYYILEELGGEATITDIRKVAREKYPDATLCNYAGTRLRQMEKYDIVKQINEGNTLKWKIMRKVKWD